MSTFVPLISILEHNIPVLWVFPQILVLLNTSIKKHFTSKYVVFGLDFQVTVFEYTFGNPGRFDIDIYLFVYFIFFHLYTVCFVDFCIEKWPNN